MADLISLADMKTYLSIATADTTKDSLLAALIADVSAAIRKYCRREFSLQTSVETFDGGVDALLLSSLPVVSITTIEDREDGTKLCTPLYGEVDSVPPLLRLDGEAGILRRTDGKWGAGYQRWKLTYSSDVSSVPADVALACKMVVADQYFRPDRTIASESFGDYNYARRQAITDPAFSDAVKELLAPYVLVAV